MKGISAYELRHGLLNRLHGVFKGTSTSQRRKKAILDAAFRMTNDKEFASSNNVTTPEEFHAMVDEYEKSGVFTKEEAQALRNAAKNALRD